MSSEGTGRERGKREGEVNSVGAERGKREVSSEGGESEGPVHQERPNHKLCACVCRSCRGC